MAYTTPLLGEAPAGNNTGTYKGYEIRFKGDGRVQATKGSETLMYHDYRDAQHWIDWAEITPFITSLVPNTAIVGDVDLTLRVLGTGFMDDSVIVFNGGDEPTTFVSASELTTGVKPSLVADPIAVPVQVRNATATSNIWLFEFTATTKMKK